MFATDPASPGTMTESLHMTGAEFGRCAWAGVNRRRRQASGADGRRLRLVLVVVVVVVTIVSSLQTHVRKLISATYLHVGARLLYSQIGL